MLGNIKTYLEYGSHFCGVEHGTQNGQETIYTTILKKTKNNIAFDKTFKEIALTKIISKLYKKKAVFLIVNNDNVLTKHIENSQSESLKLAYHAFPNINLDDFFYEVISQGNRHWVSICRKEYIEKLVLDYKAHEIYIINISLGNTIATSISCFLNDASIVTSNACISMDSDAVTSIEKKNIEDTILYDVNGLQTSNYQLLSLAAALDIILESFHPATNFGVLKQSLKNDYKQSRFYAVFMKFGLVFILTGLLINFFVFNHYFETVNSLQQTSQLNQTTKQKLLELSESVNKSQKMVDDMLENSSSKSSFYVNIIIQGLPNSILLTELNYQPLLKRIKIGQSIETEINTLLISGESNHSSSFSKWISDLEAVDWIQKVEILNYEDASTLVSNFSLKLIIEHD